MGVFLAIIKVIVAFIAFSSTTLWINNIIFEMNNPQLFTGEDGQQYIKQRNSKTIMGLIAALFWAILIVVL
jgi:hypothetical protein